LRTADWIALRLLPPVAAAYIRLLRRTGRFELRGAEVLDECRAREGRYILAFWHSRWVLMPYSYPGGRMAVLLSQHRDAEILARVLSRFRLSTARGSTTRGGAEGVRAIVRMTRDGYDVGIAPDGPRGPRRRVQPGTIVVARLTGLPIVPVAYSAAPARRLRSWDGTLVPRPFARGLFVYGTPIRVARDADDTEEERLRAALEAELDRITDLADRETGLPPEPARTEAEPG
jgi:lysophospholipid acyltransferase (LPLAT)-like uncharacterized protein